MKRAWLVGALGLALTGAAAVPVQSAFGNAAQRQAQRCSTLVQTIQILRAEYDSATDPTEPRALMSSSRSLNRPEVIDRHHAVSNELEGTSPAACAALDTIVRDS
jgi:hypothetical protein